MGGLEECYAVTGESVRVLSASENPLDCTGYRLPIEAEWEYAARAGTSSARYGTLVEVAWYRGNAGGRTSAVGGKQANAWGLHDMLGNVWEWVWDGYGEYVSTASTNPIGFPSRLRVVRGGSWNTEEPYVRAASRQSESPADRSTNVGFRLARTLP
jgi:formylglycine-generating enzyme required for sulfatase activity